MPTKQDLLREAANAGLCCFWKLNKPELLDLVNLVANKQSVSDRFLGKRKIGDTCARNDECRTRRCEKNKCVSSKYKEKVQVIKEQAPVVKPVPVVPAQVAPVAPVVAPPVLPKQQTTIPKKQPAKPKKSPKPKKDNKKPKTPKKSPKPTKSSANQLRNGTCGSMLCNYF